MHQGRLYILVSVLQVTSTPDKYKITWLWWICIQGDYVDIKWWLFDVAVRTQNFRCELFTSSRFHISKGVWISHWFEVVGKIHLAVNGKMPFTSEVVSLILVHFQTCDTYIWKELISQRSAERRKSWVISRYSGFVAQGILAGWFEISP